MKAIQYSGLNGLAGMSLVDIPIPEPGAGEMLVKVHSSGVNPVELASSAQVF
jgi:NADPH:quinone reductase-like Zn-dependent oxidoreductase